MNVLDVYREKGRVGKDQLVNATEEDLHELKILVNDDSAYIADQLDDAKAKVFTGGVYADPDWYRKANSAKRFKGRLSQHIQNELSKRKKIRKEKSRQQYEKDTVGLLLEAIHQVLTPEQRNEVLDAWKELRSSTSRSL